MNDIYEKITTNYFKVIKILYNNQTINSDKGMICKIKQIEIANQLNVNKMTINTIFKELCNDGLIYKYENNRGIYILAKEAIRIVESINKLKKGEI